MVTSYGDTIITNIRKNCDLTPIFSIFAGSGGMVL